MNLFFLKCLQLLIFALHNHLLDVVLSNTIQRGTEVKGLYYHKLAEIPLCLVYPPNIKLKPKSANFFSFINQYPIYLPGKEIKVRTDIDMFFKKHKLQPKIAAEVEDVSLLRLFALQENKCAIVPQMVFMDHCKIGELKKIVLLPTIFESFYAITNSKIFKNSNVEKVIKDFNTIWPLSRGKT